MLVDWRTALNTDEMHPEEKIMMLLQLNEAGDNAFTWAKKSAAEAAQSVARLTQAARAEASAAKAAEAAGGAAAKPSAGGAAAKETPLEKAKKVEQAYNKSLDQIITCAANYMFYIEKEVNGPIGEAQISTVHSSDTWDKICAESRICRVEKYGILSNLLFSDFDPKTYNCNKLEKASHAEIKEMAQQIRTPEIVTLLSFITHHDIAEQMTHRIDGLDHVNFFFQSPNPEQTKKHYKHVLFTMMVKYSTPQVVRALMKANPPDDDAFKILQRSATKDPTFRFSKSRMEDHNIYERLSSRQYNLIKNQLNPLYLAVVSNNVDMIKAVAHTEYSPRRLSKSTVPASWPKQSFFRAALEDTEYYRLAMIATYDQKTALRAIGALYHAHPKSEETGRFLRSKLIKLAIEEKKPQILGPIAKQMHTAYGRNPPVDYTDALKTKNFAMLDAMIQCNLRHLGKDENNRTLLGAAITSGFMEHMLTTKELPRAPGFMPSADHPGLAVDSDELVHRHTREIADTWCQRLLQAPLYTKTTTTPRVVLFGKALGEKKETTPSIFSAITEQKANNCIRLATAYGRVKTLEALMDNHKNRESIDLNNLFALATQWNQIGIMQYLIAQGADPNITLSLDAGRLTTAAEHIPVLTTDFAAIPNRDEALRALHLAIERSNAPLIRMLLPLNHDSLAENYADNLFRHMRILDINIKVLKGKVFTLFALASGATQPRPNHPDLGDQGARMRDVISCNKMKNTLNNMGMYDRALRDDARSLVSLGQWLTFELAKINGLTEKKLSMPQLHGYPAVDNQLNATEAQEERIPKIHLEDIRRLRAMVPNPLDTSLLAKTAEFGEKNHENTFCQIFMTGTEAGPSRILEDFLCSPVLAKLESDFDRHQKKRATRLRKEVFTLFALASELPPPRDASQIAPAIPQTLEGSLLQMDEHIQHLGDKYTSQATLGKWLAWALAEENDIKTKEQVKEEQEKLIPKIHLKDIRDLRTMLPKTFDTSLLTQRKTEQGENIENPFWQTFMARNESSEALSKQLNSFLRPSLLTKLEDAFDCHQKKQAKDLRSRAKYLGTEVLELLTLASGLTRPKDDASRFFTAPLLEISLSRMDEHIQHLGDKYTSQATLGKWLAWALAEKNYCVTPEQAKEEQKKLIPKIHLEDMHDLRALPPETFDASLLAKLESDFGRHQNAAAINLQKVARGYATRHHQQRQAQRAQAIRHAATETWHSVLHTVATGTMDDSASEPASPKQPSA